MFGGGAGADAIIHVVPKRSWTSTFSGLAGRGHRPLRRRRSCLMPPLGSKGQPVLHPENGTALVGLIGHPSQEQSTSTAIIGTEQASATLVRRDRQAGKTTAAYGYGNPLYEQHRLRDRTGSPASTCVANTQSADVQGTAGFVVQVSCTVPTARCRSGRAILLHSSQVRSSRAIGTHASARTRTRSFSAFGIIRFK